MKKLALVLLLCTNSFYAYCYSPKIDPYLQLKMSEATDNSLIPVIIIFNEHLNLDDFSDISYDTPKNERRRIVVERLQNYADNYQRSVREYLETKRTQNAIENYEIIWLTNAIVTSANIQVINELAENFENVNLIRYDATFPVEMLWDSKPVNAPFIDGSSFENVTSVPDPGVLLMNADDCWALGNKGKGALVANSDDGFWWKHPDLVKGIWQNLGEDANNNGKTIDILSGTSSVYDAGDINGIDNDGNGKIDDLIGWDFTTNNYNITAASHGSATLGHVVGDGTMGTQTGVSPEAKSLLLRNASGEAAQILGFQYSVLMGADVITSSLSWKWYFTPRPDYSQMRLATDMSLAAGVVHTNSTSNDGQSTMAPIPINISTAGNCPPPWLHPEQLRRGNLSGVIGVGNVHCATDIITSTSPHGPSTWGNWHLWGPYTYPIDPNHKDYPFSRTVPVEIPDSMGLLKPDVSAPGQGSISTYVSSGSGYGTFGGTSSATPHAAGCVALMLSINPEMLPQDISKVIELTSIEKGAPGKDSRYGTGRIDALAATTSPKFTVTGINGGGNMIINNTIISGDTARELAGIKLSTDVNPQVGSLKLLKFGMSTSATAAQIISFDLYWDKDRNNLVSTGDVKLKSLPFSPGPVTFDSLKFKFLDTARTLILAAKTTTSASNETVSLGLTDTNQVIAYYTTKPFNTNFPFGIITGIGNNVIDELTYSISQNYPNPFNPVTQIKYTVAIDGIVKLKVYDAIGKEIATLVNSFKTKGNHAVEFDVKDHNNLSSGVYYYKIQAGDFNDIKKMILVK
jgi:hypothetical protein